MEGGEKERKTKTDDAGMDDDRQIERAEEKSTAKIRMASLEVEICRGAGELKNQKNEDTGT